MMAGLKRTEKARTDALKAQELTRLAGGILEWYGLLPIASSLEFSRKSLSFSFPLCGPPPLPYIYQSPSVCYILLRY